LIPVRESNPHLPAECEGVDPWCYSFTLTPTGMPKKIRKTMLGGRIWERCLSAAWPFGLSQN